MFRTSGNLTKKIEFCRFVDLVDLGSILVELTILS